MLSDPPLPLPLFLLLCFTSFSSISFLSFFSSLPFLLTHPPFLILCFTPLRFLFFCFTPSLFIPLTLLFRPPPSPFLSSLSYFFFLSSALLHLPIPPSRILFLGFVFLSVYRPFFLLFFSFSSSSSSFPNFLLFFLFPISSPIFLVSTVLTFTLMLFSQVFPSPLPPFLIFAFFIPSSPSLLSSSLFYAPSSSSPHSLSRHPFSPSPPISFSLPPSPLHLLHPL